MKKYKSKLTLITAIILFIALTSVVVIQSLRISALTDMITNERQARTWDTKLIFACYNYNIHPCDDQPVSDWNEQHPNEAITEEYLRDLF